MPRLVIVLPLSPLQRGDSFAVHSWPLHITALPPFDTEADPVALAAAIAAVTEGQPAITAIAEGEDMFGRRHNVPVTVVAPNEALTGLRQTLVDVIRPFATRPDESAFTGTEFRPHITHKQHGRAHPGDAFLLTQIAIVDMAPRADPRGRAVLATLPFVAPQGSNAATTPAQVERHFTG